MTSEDCVTCPWCHFEHRHELADVRAGQRRECDRCARTFDIVACYTVHVYKTETAAAAGASA